MELQRQSDQRLFEEKLERIRDTKLFAIIDHGLFQSRDLNSEQQSDGSG